MMSHHPGLTLDAQLMEDIAQAQAAHAAAAAAGAAPVDSSAIAAGDSTGGTRLSSLRPSTTDSKEEVLRFLGRALVLPVVDGRYDVDGVRCCPMAAVAGRQQERNIVAACAACVLGLVCLGLR
jgi:hypothetical protein